MTEQQIAARGVRDPRVLAAMNAVPRELFVPQELREFAYNDSPLAIENDQTISQPFIVAVMAEALELTPNERVLEIGTGSGYAAAVLAEIAGEVYTIERYQLLADTARERLEGAGYHNVHVRHGDGTLGWPDQAPFDAIVVAAGGPEVPDSLKDQLAEGGRLVIPIGERGAQELVRVTRQDGLFHQESLGAVRFVPLVGAEGWSEPPPGRSAATTPARGREDLGDIVASAAEPFDDIDTADLDAFIDRVGDARVVLLGEASHGTSEFYRMRTRLTRALVERCGFDVVAVEADWPDAARVDRYVRHLPPSDVDWLPFERFPTWMWRNHEVVELMAWMRDHNRSIERGDRVGFFGLDVYSMYTSIAEVLRYLGDFDPETAGMARERYSCLTPWQSNPAAYGYAAMTGRYRSCENEVVEVLTDLLDRRLRIAQGDAAGFFDAVQNARVAKNAERYYRSMFLGPAESWNLRDQHMFDTLRALLAGARTKAIVWAHNSHLGDARATEMSARGEHNLGQLCRQEYGSQVYSVGFGTHQGTVAAASDWDGELELKTVRPSHPHSYERACYQSRIPRFMLPLRDSRARQALLPSRLQRAIGVVYRPENELASHYFSAILPRQFDEWIWFESSKAVTPLPHAEPVSPGVQETFPFGL